MIKIEKHDIKKLEEYIQHIDNYRRELKMREYELLESHEPDKLAKVICRVIRLNDVQ